MDIFNMKDYFSGNRSELVCWVNILMEIFHISEYDALLISIKGLFGK